MITSGSRTSSKECWGNFHKPSPCSIPTSLTTPSCRVTLSVSSSVYRAAKTYACGVYFTKNILNFCFMSWLNNILLKLFTVQIETLLMLQSQTVRTDALCEHFLWTSLLCEYVCLTVRLSVTSLTLGLLDLQIYAVTPVSDISDVPQLERVPERIKSFYRINNVSRFHYDRPFHKGPKDRENEFRVRWASSATLSHLNTG